MALCAAVNCRGQARLTFIEALKTAAEGNPTLRRQHYDTAAAEADIITAGLRPNPQITANGDMLSSRLPVLTPEAKQYGLSLSVPLEMGGKRDARLAYAEKNRETTAAGYFDARRQMMIAVANAWFDVAQARLARDVISRARSILDSVTAVNRVRLKDQVITPTELVRSQVAAQQYELLQREAELQLLKAERALGILLGSADPIDIDDRADIDFTPPTLDSMLAFAADHRSDVMVARAAMEAASANQSLQQANASADISLSADYIRQQGTPFYGISFTMPLPFFSRNQGEIQKSSIARQQAELNYETTKRQIAAEIQAVYEEYRLRNESLAKFEGLLASAEKIRSAIEYAYRTGNTTILDFLDAQRTWFDTRQAYNDALISFRRSRALLAVTSGLLAV
ncbi:MAG: TolC family protein [Chlorobi bacterium]|nr:TolC family protein [Chlorobiota bacterium]